MKKTVIRFKICICLLTVSLGMLFYQKNLAASDWETKWEQQQSEMREQAKDALESQVTLGDAKTDTSEKSTTIQKYDILEAVPVCYLKSDLSMLADYHK